MIRIAIGLASLGVAASAPLLAHAEEDELLRLPGQGELRDHADRDRIKADRLKPGAGLFIMFDTDTNGEVTPFEISEGIPLAFASADANGDGHLTAIEQRDWATGLPTRDDSLANPVRFDPNLDRRVDLVEFATVIEDLGSDFANRETGLILVNELKAPKQSRRDADPRQDRTSRTTGPARGNAQSSWTLDFTSS